MVKRKHDVILSQRADGIMSHKMHGVNETVVKDRIFFIIDSNKHGGGKVCTTGPNPDTVWKSLRVS